MPTKRLARTALIRLLAAATLGAGSAVFVGVGCGAPSSGEPTLTITASKSSLESDGTDSIDLSIVATEANGSPGMGAVIVTADSGDFNGEQGASNIVVDLTTGEAALSYSCDATKSHDCTGAHKITARWKSAMAFAKVTFAATGGPDGGAPATTSEPAWVQQIGPESTCASALDVAIDSAGNTALLGLSCGGSDPVDLGSGVKCASGFLIMYSPSGAPIWRKCLSGDKLAFGPDGSLFYSGKIGMNPDNGCEKITAHSGSYLAKLSGSDGSCLWSKTYSGPNTVESVIKGMQVDAAGDILVAGIGQDAFIANSSDPDPGTGLFLAKLSGASGAIKYARALSEPTPDVSIVGLALDGADPVVAGIVWRGTFSLGGAPIPAESGFVAKFAGADGIHVWSRPIVSAPNGVPVTAISAVGGGIGLTGRVSKDADFGQGVVPSDASAFLLKLDSAGKLIFLRFASGEITAGPNVNAVDVAMGGDGSLYWAANYMGDIVFDGQTVKKGPEDSSCSVLGRFDGSGALTWVAQSIGITSAGVEVEAIRASSGRLAIANRLTWFQPTGTAKIGGKPIHAEGPVSASVFSF